MHMTYDALASAHSVERAMKALTEHGMIPELVQAGTDALARIKALIFVNEPLGF